MTDSFLLQAAVLLAAAAIAAPLGRMLKVGSVIGYLAAGVLIGPAVAGSGGRSPAHTVGTERQVAGCDACQPRALHWRGMGLSGCVRPGSGGATA